MWAAMASTMQCTSTVYLSPFTPKKNTAWASTTSFQVAPAQTSLLEPQKNIQKELLFKKKKYISGFLAFLNAGVFGTVEMRPPTVGTWLVECTVGEFQLAGMRAKLLVYNPRRCTLRKICLYLCFIFKTIMLL